MVLYRVYSKPFLDKYYSTICSRATLFQILTYALIIIPPFFIAYYTNDFWQYTSTYREQPDVNYLNRLIIQISGKDGVGDISTWSSFPNFNLLLDVGEVATPVIESREDDMNRDGKNDILHLNVRFSNLRHEVQTVKLLLFYDLRFTQFSSVTMQSLIYLSQSWAAPASRLWVGGALGLSQRVPLPASGRVERYNTSLFDIGGQTVENFEIRNILSSYNERNVTAHLMEPPLVVWEVGNSGNFSLEVELQYPTLTVTYRPGFWQLLKFAWIQYLAIFVVFWQIIRTVQSFVFENQVILTIRKRKSHQD